ncbi:MAG: hypothetical protein ACM3ZS_07030, partial [Nitrososphaerota archaeon]
RLTWKIHNELNNYEEKFTKEEKIDRRKEFEVYYRSQFLMQKFLVYWIEGANYLVANKPIPKTITSNLTAIRDYFISLSDAISNGHTPLMNPVIRMYERYVLPDIKKKQKISNSRQKNWPLESPHVRKGIM